MLDAVKIVRKGTCAVKVVYDCEPESPRDWENLGKLHLDTRSVCVKECERDDIEKARVKLPVYKYEHSGVALSTSNASYPFNDRWDAGLAGYICAFANDIRKEYDCKRITKKIVARVEKELKNEIDTYSKYVNGEVYGFQVFANAVGIDDDDLDEKCELTDSCYGFYSVEDALADGLACIPNKEVAMAGK